FNQKSKTEPLRPPVPATLPVGHQEMMGRNKTLSNRQVRTTLEIANQIVESMNTIVKRYYRERQEGLKIKRRTQHAASTIPPGGLCIKKEREYAAIRYAGMSKPFKHAAIALKYNLDLQEEIFGASSIGSDRNDEASSDGVSFRPEIQMNPASLGFGWCSGLRRQRCWVHLTLRAKWATFWMHYCEANEIPYLPKYAEYGRVANVRRNINMMATRPTQHQQEVRNCVVFIAFANLEQVEGQIVRDEGDYEEQEDEAEENDSDTMEEDIIRTCLVDKERQTQTI
ncbi:hypothetical protein FPANT_13980, partial [Fusarium pseudoanthophilum]